MDTNDSMPPPAETSLPAHRTISGFWRRLLALFLDSLVLGLFGLALGFSLFDFFAGLGGWGRLIGFVIALVYFGVLNSALGRGKTIGKRIMKIEVVDSIGNHLSPARSILRYTILGVPFFLNGAFIPPSILNTPVGGLVGLLVFGFSGAIIYLYVFNRRTRQSLHDLVVGSFVVRSGGAGSVSAMHVWRPHLIIAVSWCLVVMVGLVVGAPLLAKTGVFPELAPVQQKLLSSGKVYTASVYMGESWFLHNGVKERKSIFQSSVILKDRPKNYDDAAGEIAAIVLATYPEIGKKDTLSVTVSYGFDIGIAHGRTVRTF